ncbi:MAG: hypothetical protein KGV59_02605 [Tenacibaculum sp.]|nr:hypothetical protein [Tenacibaculum sp.]
MCFLIPILTGIIGAILGCLICRNSCKKSKNVNEYNKDEKINKKSFVFNALAAKNVFEKNIKENDLKIVEGIGPKIEELFHNNGIKTWEALSKTSVEECNEILNSGGERFKMHTPSTWPKQAELAFKGKWEELKKWQGELDGGKE